MSVFEFVPDDDVLSVASFEMEPEEGVDDEMERIGVRASLERSAAEVQRVVVSRLAATYMRGSSMAFGTMGEPRFTPEKRFGVPRYMTWESDDASEVIAAIKDGRVRARLGAAPGKGKTMRLASLIARGCNKRVCLVTKDSLLVKDVAKFLKGKSLAQLRSAWSAVQSERVVGMTYGDFCSYVRSTERQALFKDFDVFLFDEANLGGDDAWCSLRFFSVYALEDTSVLLASATISTDAAGASGSREMGEFVVADHRVSMEELMSSGKLLGKYLVDRTLVLLATDQDVWDLTAYYEAEGIEVRSMDSATSYEEKAVFARWLSGDAVSARVLVAHECWGVGHNMPVNYVVTSAERAEWCLDGGLFKQRRVPHSAGMVLQHKARTGRGLVSGSGGLVLSPLVSEDVELYEGSRFDAFVKLIAGGVMPNRKNAMWDKCYAVMPKGLTAVVAAELCKLAWPAEVAVRYLGSDGQFAGAFCSALMAFAQPDHYLYPSRDEFPVGYSSWVEEPMGGYELDSAGLVGSAVVKVPFRSEGEMRIMMHAVYASSQAWIVVPRWRPEVALVVSEAEDSDSGEVKQHRVRARRRLIADKALPRVPVEVSTRVLEWQYNSEVSMAPRRERPARRRGGFFTGGDVARAFERLEALLDDYEVVDGLVGNRNPVTGVASPVPVEVVDSREGTVESPGGSVVCTLPARVCETLNMGQAVGSLEMQRLIVTVKPVMSRFVASKMFDCLSGPWEGYLQTLLAEGVTMDLVRTGLAGDAYKVVTMLQTRFGTEVITALSRSNVYRRTFARVFTRRPTMDELRTAVQRGKFNGVAQTDAFLNRVKYLKDLLDQVLIKGESCSVYLPAAITAAQRGLPVRSRPRLGVVGEGLVDGPGRGWIEEVGTPAVEERLARRMNRGRW